MIPPKATASAWTEPARGPWSLLRSLCNTRWSLALHRRRRNSVGALSSHLLTDIGLASADTRVGWRAIGP
jgi:uncharacterized protein YjiS (DUF1127 family)